jgi:ubiquinone/menaquinone biosynthesis C-methylase UbiE
MSYMIWADYQYIISSEFFKVTKDIYDLEQEYHKQVDCTYMRDSMHFTRRFEYPWLALNMPFGGKVLDVGSGGSSFTAFISTKPGEYIALDYDMNAMMQIDRIKETLRLSRLKGVYCNAKDMSKSFLSNTFNVTLSVSVLEHMAKDDFKKAINEIVRVTKPNGTIMLTMDVSVVPDKDRTDVEDLKWLSEKFNVGIPEVTRTTMINMIQGSDIPFYVICMKLTGFK